MSNSKSQKSYQDLLATLQEIDDRFLSDEWSITSEQDRALGYRYVMHVLQSALLSHFEGDPDWPEWKRIVSPTRKFTGDNSDSIYYETPIRGDRAYRITGNLAGAVYTSFTIEANAEDGKYASNNAGVFNDEDLDVDADGNYELLLGGPEVDGNWMALPEDAGRITTRHYFEWPIPCASDQSLHIPLTIEPLGNPNPIPPWDDTNVEKAINRVVNHIKGKTLEGPKPGHAATPSWVGKEPNSFPTPEMPGDLAFAAVDAAYSMGRFYLEPGQALVMSGRWPECRFGNVCIWNRFGQTLDYRHRKVSLNRSNTVLQEDGSFRIIVSHSDPSEPNWLNTEGLTYGSIFWRFFLPKGELYPIKTEVINV